jgi:hypothetical protein
MVRQPGNPQIFGYEKENHGVCVLCPCQSGSGDTVFEKVQRAGRTIQAVFLLILAG